MWTVVVQRPHKGLAGHLDSVWVESATSVYIVGFDAKRGVWCVAHTANGGTSWTDITSTPPEGTTPLVASIVSSILGQGIRPNVVGVALNTYHWNGTTWAATAITSAPTSAKKALWMEYVGANYVALVNNVGPDARTRDIGLVQNGVYTTYDPAGGGEESAHERVVGPLGNRWWVGAISDSPTTGFGNMVYAINSLNGLGAYNPLDSADPSILRDAYVMPSGKPWACGSRARTSGGPFPLWIYLDALGTWQPFNSTVAPAGWDTAELFGIDGVSSTDIWSVGSKHKSGDDAVVLYHWDGSSQTESVPTGITDPASLNDVAMRTATDAWAVGQANGLWLVLHWNGTAWSVVPVNDL